MNENRLCQLMLPCYILFYLAQDDRKERINRAICNYVSKHMNIFCDNDTEKFEKLSIRLCNIVNDINWFCAEGDLLKGRKMVLITVFLTQLIFNEKDGKINDKYLEVAKKTERLVAFVTSYYEKHQKDNDEKLIASAEKQAKKVYETIYKKYLG